MSPRPLTGCGTALATPFTADGAIDEAALRAFVDWQVREGVHFVVPCGSTGEAATMSLEEQKRVISITVETVAGRVPVVAGAGANDTARAIALTRMARELGATHALHVSPMYNKPPQRGIVAHFKAIGEATDLPVVVYNVPGRTGSNIEAKTTIELAGVKNMHAVKEASGNLGQISDIIRGRPKGFVVLSGDDELTLPVMALGGEGIVSVVSNAIPGPMAKLCDLMAKGEFGAARDLHMTLLPFMRAAFIESNPLPIKASMAMLGKMKNVLRLPLVPMSEAHNDTVKAALKAAGAL